MTTPAAMGTGQLRALLQPVIFVTLVADVPGTPIKAGDHAALQYWGGGDVRVTSNPRVTPPYSVMVKAHDVHAVLPPIVQGSTAETGEGLRVVHMTQAEFDLYEHGKRPVPAR